MLCYTQEKHYFFYGKRCVSNFVVCLYVTLNQILFAFFFPDAFIRMHTLLYKKKLFRRVKLSNVNGITFVNLIFPQTITKMQCNWICSLRFEKLFAPLPLFIRHNWRFLSLFLMKFHAPKIELIVFNPRQLDPNS